jgi:CubicO group peptidase (beta-lactamase class C family)
MKNIILLLFLSHYVVAQKPGFSLQDSLKKLLLREYDAYGFSGVLLVARQGEPIFYSALGVRDYAKNIPLSKHSVFELASISKTFTAMIIMMLQERGKLGFDDPLDLWIKDLPYRGIKIRHLLTHTSGLPDYQAMMEKYWDKSKVADNIDVIEYLKKYPEPLRFEPGDQYEYSNTGYLLLASIAEAASHTNFIQLCREWIFEPAKMTTADIRTAAARAGTPNFAKGHLYDSLTRKYIDAAYNPASNYTIWLGNRKGPGRVSANAADLLKWDQALYTALFVSKPTLREAYSPYRLNNGELSQYGFGWDLEIHPKLGQVVGHSGDNPGYRTQLKRYLDHQYTVIVLNNNASPRMESILESVQDYIIQKLIFDNADGLMDSQRRRN